MSRLYRFWGMICLIIASAAAGRTMRCLQTKAVLHKNLRDRAHYCSPATFSVFLEIPSRRKKVSLETKIKKKKNTSYTGHPEQGAHIGSTLLFIWYAWNFHLITNSQSTSCSWKYTSRAQRTCQKRPTDCRNMQFSFLFLSQIINKKCDY